MTPDATVFVVDDDPDVAERNALLLGVAGAETAVVIEPKQVVDSVRELSPDVILMDINTAVGDAAQGGGRGGAGGADRHPGG